MYTTDKFNHNMAQKGRSEGGLAVQQEQRVDRGGTVRGKSGSIRERGSEELPKDIAKRVVLYMVLSSMAAEQTRS